MHFVLAHGFNVMDGGQQTTDKFVSPLRKDGHEVSEADYGWRFLLSVRLFNRSIARKYILPKVRPGSIGIGHSNGCALLSYAAEMGAPFNTVILINPALDSDYAFPKQVKNILVIYNEKDYWVKLAKLLPSHRWGAQGRRGFTGIDHRYTQYSSYQMWGVEGHSAVFSVFPQLYKLCLDYLEKIHANG